MSRVKMYCLLHTMLLIYSVAAVFLKMAAGHSFFSIEFIAYFTLVIFIMFTYAIVWQQILKHISLAVAISNKGVVIIWVMLWGTIFFDEKISITMVIGSLIVILGIILVATDDN